MGCTYNPKDLQRYVWEYFNIGIDEDGLECADDLYETKINNPFDNYWDESEGNPIIVIGIDGSILCILNNYKTTHCLQQMNFIK